MQWDALYGKVCCVQRAPNYLPDNQTAVTNAAIAAKVQKAAAGRGLRSSRGLRTAGRAGAFIHFKHLGHCGAFLLSALIGQIQICTTSLSTAAQQRPVVQN